MPAEKKDYTWWKHGVIYQIYPRSFNDSDGDGIGDIPGIIEKLDYLADLGIDGIWLSPINLSPMFDFGYDISDYRSIDPAFGTIDDFKKLIAEAHRRNIHIIMDLVINHSSHLHPWFIESRSDRESPKRDWYIWHEGTEGKYPNNWMAAFGGHAWEWDRHTEQYYLHLFLKEQPDLNWRNPELKKAVFQDIRFWLDLGVDGFRLDVINYIVKDREFRSNPYWIHKTNPRRHDMQRHDYDRNRPETHEILRELRKLMDEYGETMTVGEIYPNEGIMEPETSASYLGNGHDELHLAFDFSPVYTKFKAGDFKNILSRWYDTIPAEGWPCHVLSNHDQSRSMSRLAKGSIEKAKLLNALLLTQRGTPFLYYGEEIGMTDGKVPRKEIVDPVGKKYWPFHPGRDPERTPMQWDDSPGAGFTTGNSWLPIPRTHRDINAAGQTGKNGSLLEFTRSLITLRKTSEAMQRGSWQLLESHKDILAYIRGGKKEAFTVILNFSKKPVLLDIENQKEWMVTLGTHRAEGSSLQEDTVTLQPFEALILKKV